MGATIQDGGKRERSDVDCLEVSALLLTLEFDVNII